MRLALLVGVGTDFTFPGPKMKYKIEWPYGLPVKKNRLAEKRIQAFLERCNIVCMGPITQGKENVESAPPPRNAYSVAVGAPEAALAYSPVLSQPGNFASSARSEADV